MNNCDDDDIHPDVLELLELRRLGHKVILPNDLGIVFDNHEHDDIGVPASPLHDDSCALGERAVISRNDVIDMVDLHELGGSVVWPTGLDLHAARFFLKEGLHGSR